MSPPRYLAILLLCLTPLLPGCDQAPTGPASSRLSSVRGLTFADWTAEGYARPAAFASMNGLAETGASDVVLVITAYQNEPRSPRLRHEDPRTPLPNAVRTALRHARARGLRTALKPHVDLDSGEWRGRITPPDPTLWFSEYAAFVLAWARVAEEESVTRFVVGTELVGTLSQVEEWRTLIAAIRTVFSGELTYAASWDEAALVPFWRDLDAVGVDFYAPVTVRNQAGRFEMLRGWQDWIGRLRRLHEQTGLPVLLTEIGYRSVDGAGRHPYRFGNEAPLDLAEQADLYWAALQVVNDNSWLAGVYFWNWMADGSGGTGNRDFTPRGKPAETVLREAWRNGE